MQNLNYFIDYNSNPSNSSHNSSTNETMQEYKTYPSHKYAQACSPYNLYQNASYHGFPRKIKKICENPIYEKKEIFNNFPERENSQTFPFTVFQREISNALCEQEGLFRSVYHKNQDITSDMDEIRLTISELKRTINNLKNKEASSSNTIISQLENSENRERIIHKSLRLNDCFRYELALYSEFPNVLIRERLFSFKVVLRNFVSKTLVKNSKKIKIGVKIFSGEDVPKEITENKSGKPIIQNEKENYLSNGECVVGRLKINEVSSHFAKALFTLCVYCEGSQFEENDEIVASEIKPLIITNFKVKSKK